MISNKIDFSIIKIQVLMFIVFLVILVLSIIGVDHVVEESKVELSRINESLNVTRNSLNIRNEAISLDKKMHHQYANLYGFSYSQPDKLKWLEQIQQQAEFLQLPSMTYNIKARQVSEKFSSTLTSQYAVYETEIELQLGLLHESQQLEYFERLKHVGLGIFSVQSCEMAVNSGSNEQFKPATANVTAQCLIDWYQVDKRSTDAVVVDPTMML